MADNNNCKIVDKIEVTMGLLGIESIHRDSSKVFDRVKKNKSQSVPYRNKI